MAIEEHLGTKDHIFRLFSTIFGMCIVDAFKFYYIANPSVKSKGLKKFIEAAATPFLTNRRAGGVSLPDEGRRLRKRGADSMLCKDDEEETVSEVDTLMSVTEWKKQNQGASSIGAGAQLKGAKVRCQVDKCGHEACYCCVLCSKTKKSACGVC